jgi:hypothetical protein
MAGGQRVVVGHGDHELRDDPYVFRGHRAIGAGWQVNTIAHETLI